MVDLQLTPISAAAITAVAVLKTDDIVVKPAVVADASSVPIASVHLVESVDKTVPPAEALVTAPKAIAMRAITMISFMSKFLSKL